MSNRSIIALMQLLLQDQDDQADDSMLPVHQES